MEGQTASSQRPKRGAISIRTLLVTTLGGWRSDPRYSDLRDEARVHPGTSRGSSLESA